MNTPAWLEWPQGAHSPTTRCLAPTENQIACFARPSLAGCPSDWDEGREQCAELAQRLIRNIVTHHSADGTQTTIAPYGRPGQGGTHHASSRYAMTHHVTSSSCRCDQHRTPKVPMGMGHHASSCLSPASPGLGIWTHHVPIPLLPNQHLNILCFKPHQTKSGLSRG